ncbi:unnamed protein product [Calypogeia fissa]
MAMVSGALSISSSMSSLVLDSTLCGRHAPPPASALKVSSSGRAFNGGGRIQVAPAAARAPQWRSLEVSAMAKREQQLVEIRQMSDESIGQTVIDLKGELFVLRCKQATRQEYKSSDFRKVRKQIARMLTVRREREIERGVSVRESRKLDREWKKNAVIRPPASLESLNKSS